MHVFPAAATDCILQTISFGLVNCHIFRPNCRNCNSLGGSSISCRRCIGAFAIATSAMIIWVRTKSKALQLYFQKGPTFLIPDLVGMVGGWCRIFHICNFVFEQGSIVVFGSFKAWSDLDLDTDTEDPNYCPNTPMMFAFVLLILSWVGRTFGRQNTRSF